MLANRTSVAASQFEGCVLCMSHLAAQYVIEDYYFRLYFRKATIIFQGEKETTKIAFEDK